ncbi:hypothetical protein BD410DRAFT_735397 [Rickenella mellea]|uniref:Prolyl 4-hydroxylase alpha subunit Fe(2+) 2OG dioxygenase domain-containing protein n=1 Tax=Rickenella mellea TaxID=50990 RepID=A0A4Y7PDP3_9AGAM|nr:hypothetical protein BD410DRAFT_735397 [Rickenella mellea]
MEGNSPSAASTPFLPSDRTPRPLIDEEGRIFGALAGQPDDWLGVSEEAVEGMQEAASNCVLPSNNENSRRGNFPALNFGVTFGPGMDRPANLKNDLNTAPLRALMDSRPFQRISGFQNSAFRIWAPRLYDRYSRVLGELYARDRTLRPTYPGSVFSSQAVNFGPRVICYPHTDHANVPYGWCAVTALGSFDPQAGGHLVLWDLNLAIQFPAGSTILIPSATLRHSNTSTQPHESRFSFTQYTAGGLFRWVAYGHRLERDFAAADPDGMKRLEARRSVRGREALGLFSTLSELEDRTH